MNVAEQKLLKIAPNSAPQAQFFAASEDEVLYGGAAGSGKSFALVVDPLRYISVSDYTAIIFRRTYPELEGSIVPLTQKYYPHAGGRWNEQKKTWTFPSGATIKLGFMQHEDDWTNYQGHEYAGQYFDELTNFRWVQYESLKVWNRSRAAGIRGYRRATSNPGGVGHKQTKAYFVDTCRPVPDGPQRFSKLANMWWQPMKAGPTFRSLDPHTQRYMTRRFIPARVFDNEDLLANNPNYVSALMQLPVHRRKMYVEGDWEVFEGQFFDLRPDLHVIPSVNPEKFGDTWPVLGGLDYGATTVLLVGYRDHEGNVVIFHENVTRGLPPSERANSIADSLIERRIKRLAITYDTNMDISLKDYIGYEKTPSAIFREVFTQKMKGSEPTMYVVSKATTDRRGYRIVTNEAIKEFMHYAYDSNGLLVKRPKLYITRDCKYLLETMPELIHDPDSYEGMDFRDDIGEDHGVDALKYLLMGLNKARTIASNDVAIKNLDDYMYQKVFPEIHKQVVRKKTNFRTI